MAACAGMDTTLFFPKHPWPDAYGYAIKVCEGCPVRVQCLDYALTCDMRFGMWGGMTQAERRIMKRTSYKIPMYRDGHGDAKGTLAGYYRHNRLGEQACEECRIARNTKLAEIRRQTRETQCATTSIQ